MSISELYESGTQKNNVAHFAAIANIAAIDGQINEEEQKLLFRFADKLGITENQLSDIMNHLAKYPVPAVSSKEERLEYLYDLFKMIFADHKMDEQERKLIHKYAIGLGCSEAKAQDVIARSVKIFSGDVDFEDYKRLIEKD